MLLAQLEGAVSGGLDVVQIREPDLTGGELTRFVKDCVSLVRGTPTTVLVNDRADIVIAAGAHGLHLRDRGVSIEAARGLLDRGCAIGRSIHTAEAAAKSRAADYMIAGSVFSTVSKPGRPARVGLRGLAAVVVAAGECPVWAIGGVTPERVQACRDAGASGVAGIGAFIAAVPRPEVAAAVETLTRNLRSYGSAPA